MLVYDEVTAPTAEPVTLQEAKRHLRVDISEDDTHINSLISAARRYVELFTGRQLMKATYDLFLDAWPNPADGAIYIPRTPLISVANDWATEGIRYVDPDGTATSLADTVYTVDTAGEPGRVYLSPSQSWPSLRSQRKAVTIRFICGYSSSATVATQQAAVPNTIKAAILMSIEDLYHNRGLKLDDPNPAIMSLLSSETVEAVL
jgi:uncharacterized phiE125 gp8 family phage protein